MTTRIFGVRAGETVHAYTIRSASGMTAEILDWGAAINSVRLDGDPASEVAVGFADATSRRDDYFGAIIGRVSNRIKDGHLVIDGQPFQLTPNEGRHTLHGGPQGFHHRIWTVSHVAPDTLQLALTSPDGDQGFPGEVPVSATYRVAGRTLSLDLEATTTAPTALSLTNHVYWNLAGGGSVDDHRLQVDADQYLPVDAELIPLGDLSAVAGTPFDLRSLTPIGVALRQNHPQIGVARGFDHTFCVRGTGVSSAGDVATQDTNRQGANRQGAGGTGTGTPNNSAAGDGRSASFRRHARVEHPGIGRALEVWADTPGIQVYTGNAFDGSLVARSGRRIRQGDALALEPGCYPDTPHHPQWGDITLRPGQTWRARFEWRFQMSADI